ncbi:helix-turn-helix domain-containing protein [Streptomyces sp. NPDC002536]
MRLTSPFTIELTQAEREVLERLAGSRTAPFGQVQRASVILALAEGMSNAATARAAGRHVDTVRSWHKRFTAQRPAALVDRPRPLGRPRLSAEDKLQVVAAATAATAQPPTPCGPTDCYPITCAVPAWRSPPPRSDGSWPASISSRIWCAVG